MGVVGETIKKIAKGIKGGVKTIIPKEETSPIIATVKTDYPKVYEYYYEGHDTSNFKGYTIIWRKGIKDKEKEKVLEDLKKVLP